jgi:hypothetical protein
VYTDLSWSFELHAVVDAEVNSCADSGLVISADILFCKVQFQVFCHLMALSVSRLHSLGDGVINECELETDS